MLSLSLITLGLATIGAYAKHTVRAVGGLEVSLSTPADKVASVSDLRVIATVKNVGEGDLKILKLGTVLDDEHPTRSFIVSKYGKDVPFTGIEFLLVTDPPSKNDGGDWVVVPAGKNVTAEHDVSTLYDFSAGDQGTFTFNPVLTFQVIVLDDGLKPTSDATHFDVDNVRPVSITVTGGVSKREKRGNIECGDTNGSNIIQGSLRDAIEMSRNAVSYIRNRGADDPVYKTYFGSSSISAVIDNFNRMGNENPAPGTLSCSDPVDFCRHLVAAYVDHSNKNIYYCPAFSNQPDLRSLCEGNPVVDLNLRAGTTIQQLALALGFSYELGFVRGIMRRCGGSEWRGGNRKITNAYNYHCFAAQVYKDTKC